MASGIYQITDQVNGKRYIGSAVNLKKRYRDHLSSLRQGQHRNRHLQAAFDKHGESAFAFSVLEHIERSLLIEREQYFFDTLSPEYNIAPTAGNSLGRYHSEETKRKMSEAMRGELSHWYGKHHYKESKRKISEANRGRQLSTEHRRKLSVAWSGERNPLYGKSPSAETRRKISDANRGRHHTEQAKRKMSEAHKGKHHSDETKGKISQALKGQQPSKETRAKLSAAQKGKHLSSETRARMSKAQKARRCRERAATQEQERRDRESIERLLAGLR